MMDIQMIIELLGRRARLWVTAMAVACGVFGVLASSQAESAERAAWYRVPIQHGEENDYLWGFAAKGKKFEGLKELCGAVVTVPPRDPDVGYVETDETKLCGQLRNPRDSISIGVSLGSSESGVTALIATLYNPTVRKVTFVLDTGERRTYRTASARVARRASKGIPAFRALVAMFDGGTCLRRIITADAQGDVVKSERAEPSCL